MKKPISKVKRIILIILMVYLGFLAWIITSGIFDGGLWPKGVFILWPGAGIRAAWRMFSPEGWCEIFGAVLLAVPIGVLCPFLVKKMRKLVFFLLMIIIPLTIIEMLPVLLENGSFVMDELLGHLLGAMIGFGWFRLISRFHAVSNRKKLLAEIREKKSYKVSRDKKDVLAEVERRARLWPVLLLQLPLIFCVVFFLTLFVVYHGQKYGNLSCMYAARASLTDARITVRGTYSEKREDAAVFEAVRYDERTAEELAEELFKRMGRKMGTVVSADRESVCYRDKKGEAELWIELVGGKYMMTDYSRKKTADTGKTGLSENEVCHALAEWEMRVPRGAVFSEKGSGMYVFTCEAKEQDDNLYDGSLVCELDREGKLCRVDRQMLQGRSCGNCVIMSRQEAYAQFIAGKFEAYGYESGRGIFSIDLKRMKKGYALDTKGYCQPIYRLEVELNGKDTEIDIPAMIG